MKKVLTKASISFFAAILIGLLSCSVSFGQNPNNQSDTGTVVNYKGGLKAARLFVPPVYPDTTAANLIYPAYSRVGRIIYCTGTSTIWTNNGTVWAQSGSGGGGGTQDLQSVTDIGATTTNPIIFNGGISTGNIDATGHTVYANFLASVFNNLGIVTAPNFDINVRSGGSTNILPTGSGNVNISTSLTGKAYYNGDEIATVGQLPSIMGKINYSDSNTVYISKYGIDTAKDALRASIATKGSGTVTSVGLNMPSAFSVTGSPVTGSSAFTVTGNGTSAQYITGTGALATTPTSLPPSGTAGGDLTGTYPNPTLLRQLTPTAVKTANYTASVNDFVPCDNTSGSFTITLPTAPADKSIIGIKMVIQGSTNTITIQCGGSDVINKSGGSASLSLALLNEGKLLQYKASTGIWYAISDNSPRVVVTAGTNVIVTGVGTTASPYVINSTGGGSSSGTFGVRPTTFGLVFSQSFNTGSLPTGWSAGSGLTTSYVGGFLTVTGGGTNTAPGTGDETTPWTLGMQYNLDRIPSENSVTKITVIPTTVNANASIQLIKGNNGFNFANRESVGIDLSTSGTSGRWTLGPTDMITTWTKAIDSQARAQFIANDTMDYTIVKAGYSVTTLTYNRRTGVTVPNYFPQLWNGQGGLWNFCFVNGTYKVLNISVTDNEKIGKDLWIGDSQFSGSGSPAEPYRVIDQLYKTNNKYFDVIGLPSVSAKYIWQDSISVRAVRNLQPAHLIVGPGYNDANDAGITAAQYKVFMDSIIRSALKAGVDVSVVGLVPKNATTDPFNDSLQSLANFLTLDFVDLRSVLKDATGRLAGKFSADEIHLNRLGQTTVRMAIEAKLGYKLLRQAAIDTASPINTFDIPYLPSITSLFGTDNSGKFGRAPNNMLTTTTGIFNTYSDLSNANLTPFDVAQPYSAFHISSTGTSDTAFAVTSVTGLHIGFWNTTDNTVGTNVDIVNGAPPTVGLASPQGYDLFSSTANANIRIAGSYSGRTKTNMLGVITGSRNTLLNTNITSGTLSGNDNIAIGTNSFAATTASRCIYLGINAGRGQTTGSENIEFDVSSSGTASRVAGMTKTIMFGSSTAAFDNEFGQTGDVVFAPGVNGNAYYGGKSSGFLMDMNPSAALPGTNTNGVDWDWNVSRGIGTGNDGGINVNAWVVGSSGVLLHTVKNRIARFDQTGLVMSKTLSLRAGTATAGTSPLKFASGTNLTTTEAGAVEYNGTHLYFTAANAGTRYQLDQQGVSNYSHNISTPTTGGTVSLTNNQYNIINPSGSLLALTVNLPSSPVNNDVVYIKYTQAITTVTYGNGTVVDGVTSPISGGLLILVYDAGTTSWY